jgi:membrane protein YdbS with pleckstrin-like domain
MLPADLIHDDEIIILLLRPSMLYVPLAALSGLGLIAVLTLALAYMARLPWVGWTDSHAFMLGLGLAALRLGWQALEWWSRLYVLTDRRIIRRMGVLRVAVFQTPLKNIQHISVFRRVRERLFSLGTIGFATAGSDVYEAFWVMVNQPFAVHKVVSETMERYGRH